MTIGMEMTLKEMLEDISWMKDRNSRRNCLALLGEIKNIFLHPEKLSASIQADNDGLLALPSETAMADLETAIIGSLLYIQQEIDSAKAEEEILRASLEEEFLSLCA